MSAHVCCQQSRVSVEADVAVIVMPADTKACRCGAGPPACATEAAHLPLPAPPGWPQLPHRRHWQARLPSRSWRADNRRHAAPAACIGRLRRTNGGRHNKVLHARLCQSCTAATLAISSPSTAVCFLETKAGTGLGAQQQQLPLSRVPPPTSATGALQPAMQTLAQSEWQSGEGVLDSGLVCAVGGQWPVALLCLVAFRRRTSSRKAQ